MDETYIVSLEMVVTASSPQEAVRHFLDDATDRALYPLAFTVNGTQAIINADDAFADGV